MRKALNHGLLQLEMLKKVNDIDDLQKETLREYR